MDVLTDWLREIVTSEVVLSRSRVTATWGMQIAKEDGPMFHIITEGTCWLKRVGEAPLRLFQGDLVLLPQGLDHELVDDPGSKSEPLKQFLARPSFPLTGSTTTTLICGVYRSSAHVVHPLLSAVPSVVYLPASVVRTKPSLAAALTLLTAEVEQPAPGGEALVQNLFDALLIYVIRAWAEETTADRPGWLAALKNPALSKALTRMHADLAAPWTIDSLAREVGLSRATFARRFTELVGEPPLAYLTRWRMTIAARMLRGGGASVSEVAERVGYESEFAFSRAFKRSHGIAPGGFRRTSAAGCPT